MKKILSIILSVTLILTTFTSCEAIDKALASTYLNLGEKYLTDLDYEQAIVYFNKLIDVEPKNESAYLGIAEAYLALGDIDSAIEILEQGIAIVDAPADLEAMLEECYAQMLFVTTLIYEYDSDGSVSIWYEVEYDSNGNPTKGVTYNSDGSLYSETELDSSGNISGVYYSNGYDYEYEYDSSGNQTKYVRYDTDGNVGYWCEWEYEYDAYGNETKMSSNDSSGNSNYYYYEYEYNSNGSVEKSTFYDSDGWCEEYEYDSNGNVIKFTVYDSDGSIEYSDEYENSYEYDSNGNIVKYMIDGNIDSEYEYDLNSNLLKKANYYIDGNIYETDEYEYYPNGSIWRVVYLYFDRNVNYTEEYCINGAYLMGYSGDYTYDGYEYDSDGKIIGRKYVVYGSNGTLYYTIYQTRIN